MNQNTEKFENLLCSKGDEIDNAAYFLAVAIKHNQPRCPLEEEALALLNAMAPNDDIPHSHAIISKTIDGAKKLLISQSRYNPSDPPIGLEVEAEDVLEWDMEYLGEINDIAESELLDAGFHPCYPAYIGDDATPCYMTNQCSPLNCPMHT